MLFIGMLTCFATISLLCLQKLSVSQEIDQMTNYKVEVIPGPTNTFLGEGPHWDIETQSLYFVDIYDGAIFRYDYAENKVYKCKISNEEMVSFISPIEGAKNKFLIGIERRVGIVKWDGVSESCSVESTYLEVETEPQYDKNRFNDAKIDPKGRLYAGTMRREDLGEDVFKNTTGGLYVKEVGKPIQKLLSGIGISNGLTWNLAKKKFYYIDSIRLNVTEYDYDPDTGAISNPKVLTDFHSNGERPDYVPDGMTIDKDGFLYVATFGGSRIFKINPDNGKIVLEIVMPAEQITSVAFGGPNLDILYATSSSRGDKPAPAGALFKITNLNTAGLPMAKAKI